jgi:5-methylcytosine-specific restriction enzyme A
VQLPSRPCSQQGCPNLNCTEHSNAKRYDHARRDDSERKIYNSRRWRRLRELALARDPICKACNAEAARIADHVKPIKRGGAEWSLDNLQGLCVACHQVKTRAENG